MRITPVKEARRFYGMFGFLGNFGLLLSGPAIIFISHSINSLGLNRSESTGLMLQYLMALVIVAGIVLLSTFYWMNRNVLTDQVVTTIRKQWVKQRRKRAKLSMDGKF